MSARLVLLVLIALMSGACSRERSVACAGGSLYLDAESAEQLSVPDNLTVPDETDALRVPGPTPSADADDDSGACLEYSPAFSESE